MVKKRECYSCKKIIKNKDKQVELSTFKNGKNIQRVNWHFQCWYDYFNSKVMEKAKNQVQNVQQQAVKIFDSPMMQHLLQQVQGSEVAIKMLKTPLTDKGFKKVKKSKDAKSKTKNK
jgi:hypothetical protein